MAPEFGLKQNQRKINRRWSNHSWWSNIYGIGIFFPPLLEGRKEKRTLFCTSNSSIRGSWMLWYQLQGYPSELDYRKQIHWKGGGSHLASVSEAKRDPGRTFIAFYFILTSTNNLKRGVHTTTHFKELLWTFKKNVNRLNPFLYSLNCSKHYRFLVTGSMVTIVKAEVGGTWRWSPI